MFEQPDELAWLESQVHPRVGEAVLEWRGEIDPEVPVAVIEVPLLFEAAMEKAFDETVAVIADDEIRERRLAERGQPGLEGREERQLPQAEKAARADRVIHNNGTVEELEREVAAVLEAAGAEAGGMSSRTSTRGARSHSQRLGQAQPGPARRGGEEAPPQEVAAGACARRASSPPALVGGRRPGSRAQPRRDRATPSAIRSAR